MQPIISLAGTALIAISLASALALMFRTLRGIGTAPRAVDDEAAGTLVQRRNTFARTVNVYTNTADSTLFYVLEAGLLAGGLLIVIFDRSNVTLFSVVGALSITVSILSAVMILVSALFDLAVPADRRSAGWVIYLTELIAGFIFFALVRDDNWLSITGSVIIGLSLLAAIGLLFGALVEGRVSSGARGTLWVLFWSSLVIGIVILYAPTLLDRLFP
jgi:hypothetical protein